jgi:predicted peroxiredoxin
VQRLGRRLDVDPRLGGEGETHLAAPVEREHAPQLRQQRAERVARRGIDPERLGELVARHGPEPVDGEVREREPPLPAGQLGLDTTALDAGDEPSAELDPRLPQGSAKVTASASRDNRGMAKLLINLTHGPEAPTRAALGFLVGRAAAEEGHDVSLFLAGDAVQLLREPTLDGLVGLGTGSLRESYDAIVAHGGRFYVSGKSSQARGYEPDREVEAALPSRLVELAFEADRVLTY